MKLSAIIIGLVFIAGAAYAMGQVNNESYSWRYKMTVTVETPEGDISGSAVRQMGNSPGGSFPPETGNPANVRGEAVVVDLAERGVLFALIDDKSDLEFYSTFKEPNGKGGSTPEGIEYYASLLPGTKGELGTDRYLRLVTFTDMDDPKSVTLVYNKKICGWAKEPQEECAGKKYGTYTAVNRFEELFGGGVRLKGVTLEITNEPVTWGVADRYLSWLQNYYDKRLDGNRYGTIKAKNKTANALSAGVFSTGERK